MAIKIERAAVLAAILLCLCSGPALAGEVSKRLQDFTAGPESFSAGFVQTCYNESDEPIRERPGPFRWEYRKPYEPLIVADGARIWIDDKDREQVTAKKTERALGTAPIMRLSKREPLEEPFNIKDLRKRETPYWVCLQPKVVDTDFESIDLGLDERSLQVMELRERFDQATPIRFHPVKLNPAIESGTFEFTPPEGIDVIGPAASGDGEAG